MSIKRGAPPPTEEGFEISVDDLRQLMELRKKEATEHLTQKIGGTERLLHCLQTSDTAGWLIVYYY